MTSNQWLAKSSPSKAEVDKLGINKLTNVPTSFNNLKTKVKYLDDDKLKSVRAALKKLSDAVDNKVTKNKKSNALRTKVNNLEKKIPDATTFNSHKSTQINKIYKKKLEMLIKKYQIQWFSDYNCCEYKH